MSSSYPFQSPRAQVSSSLPPHHDPYANDPYSSSHPQQHYAPYSGQADDDDGADYAQRTGYPDQRNNNNYYREDLGDSYDSNPSRGINQPGRTDEYNNAGVISGNSPYNDSANMTSEKAGYDDAYAAKRASGNSIWTKDDKRAFASRSAPAKICRFLIGNLILAIIIVVSIICLIVMFLRPPNVAISGVSVPNQNAVTYQNGAFAFNVSVDISVSNPNSISASIKKLKATAYDAQDQSTALGNGLIENQKIQPNANTTVVFPFQIRYDQSEDPDFSIIRSIATDCGLNLFGGSGGGSGNLGFVFKIEVDVDVLSITVPANFKKSVSFPCPLSGSSLQGILSGLGSALGGVGKREILAKKDEHGDGLAEALIKRQMAKANALDLDKISQEMSPGEFAAAVANGLVSKYSPLSPTQDHHDAL
ncbi:uncharacterized protein UHOD_04484 [Ustilago sp. UG-2017b]|nr:uncharacterized protein UHOD_04484 [Ustilago sp. UG-2017b]